MAKLARTASGARHLRWGLEIAATMRAHLQYNERLSSAAQRPPLGAELALLDTQLGLLEGAVLPYQRFIQQAHLEVRAKQRVADYLCDEAQRDADSSLRRHRSVVDQKIKGGFGAIWSKAPMSRVLKAGRQATAQFALQAATLIQTLPETLQAAPLAAALERAGKMLDGFNKESEALEAERGPLRAAVEKQVAALRELLEQVDGRLRTHFPQAFIDSLYPELSRSGTAIADEEDGEDDMSGPPEPPAAPAAQATAG
jgi:hypothetical protein